MRRFGSRKGGKSDDEVITLQLRIAISILVYWSSVQ